MSKSLTKKVSVFITVDLQTINSYFNMHDPAPLYKRQISQKFEEYMLESVKTAKRYSVIFYKLNCPNTIDKQYAEPLMYAIHRHFGIRKTIKEDEFKKFKRKNFILLGICALIVVLCEAFLPLLITASMGDLHSGVKNCLDIFSWVILWRPINQLIYEWNPYLKEISILNKLATAEVIILQNEKISEIKKQPKMYVTDDDLLIEKPVRLQSILSAI